MRLTGLDRLILERARDGGAVLEDDAPAVVEAYRRLDADGLLAAEWFGDDALPIQVEVTPAGRIALQLDALH